MFTTFTIVVLIVLIVLYLAVRIVPMHQVFVIERLGKFRAVLRPGFHMLIPFFDRIAYTQEMREQVVDVPSQTCITRDNMQVAVDGLVYVKVFDPERASYGIENYRVASVNLAQTTMRSEIGKLALNETFSEREVLNETIVREIDKASDSWGVKMLRYELRNITPSAGVIHTLEKQMEAEREKRAEVTMADAERQSTINLSEGERQEQINISEGERQRRINEAKGRAQSITLVADATAEGTRRIADAINQPGGVDAVRMQLAEQFIETFGQIIDKATISVLPVELAKVSGFFQGLAEITETLPSHRQTAFASSSPTPASSTEPPPGASSTGPWSAERGATGSPPTKD